MTESQIDLLEQRLAEVRRADEEEARIRFECALRAFDEIFWWEERMGKDSRASAFKARSRQLAVANAAQISA